MERQYISVHALNRYLKAKIDQDYQLQDLWIKGEISNYRPHPSGHMYFTLKDEQSYVSAVMFASQAKRLRFKAENGMKVLIHARVSVYEARGVYQLYVEDMREDGLGDLFYQFEQLKAKLEKEGLFDPSHKKPIPQFPRTIAILSAKQGAALQDTLRTIKNRFPVVRIVIFPVPVQGKDAYLKIIETLQRIDGAGFSTILLVRGGGSIEELWNFNEEALVFCLYNMKTPVITGVGHETDFTLVDFVSDLRSATPTAAAVSATPDIRELNSLLKNKEQKINVIMRNRLTLERNKVNHYMQHYILNNPGYFYENEILKLNSFKDHLLHYGKQFLFLHQQSISSRRKDMDRIMKAMLTTQENQFKGKVETLDLVSPLKILSRGYGIIKKENHVITSVNNLHAGDEVTLTISDGSKEAIIK